MAYTLPYLSMLDTTSQAIAVADTPQVVTFNTTVLASKIAVTSSSRFTIAESGNYNLILNFEIFSTGANKTLDIWARLSGTDVANSNSKNTLVSVNDSKDIAHTINFTATAGQYVEVWISGDSTNLSLLASAAGVTPTRPTSPSIYLKLEKLP